MSLRCQRSSPVQQSRNKSLRRRTSELAAHLARKIFIPWCLARMVIMPLDKSLSIHLAGDGNCLLFFSGSPLNKFNRSIHNILICNFKFCIDRGKVGGALSTMSLKKFSGIWAGSTALGSSFSNLENNCPFRQLAERLMQHVECKHVETLQLLKSGKDTDLSQCETLSPQVAAFMIFHTAYRTEEAQLWQGVCKTGQGLGDHGL